MKRYNVLNKLLLFVLMLCVLPQSSRAQETTKSCEGWPANYEGVMLQGFYWDSFKEIKWKQLTDQAEELSSYFDLIWVPNSGNCINESMGYDPVYWFNHKSSSFGTEEELRTMINTFKLKGTGIIEDVVINHKRGVNDWCDFAKEEWKGNTISWTMADICSNDECVNSGYKPTGQRDDGDNFDGFRDLDHNSPNVQKNVKLYLDFLLTDLGYAGFRYDMVKGYAGFHLKDYNTSACPKFSVGEYWDGSYDNVKNWIEATGRTSAAFDFPLKYQLNSAFESSNWSALNTKGLAGDCSDGGMNRYAVTFVDNHDTYRDNNKLSNNQMAANAFILALPGTPCIFWKHWVENKEAIKAIVKARKAAGISNTSKITRQELLGGGYVMEVQGSKGSVACLSGYVQGFDTTGWKLVNSGENYAYYVSENVDNGEIPTQPIEQTEKLYLKPNKNWLTNGARFAAYFFDPVDSNTNPEVWADMEPVDNSGYYSVDRNANYRKIIFCRMNPDKHQNNWNEGVRWNQTGDLQMIDDNCFVLNEEADNWNNAAGHWEMYNAIYVDFNAKAEGYSTLFADYAVKIPEGVTAYTGKVEGEKLQMTRYEGNILPEKTAVLLKGEVKKYLFERSYETPAAISGNDLKGNWVDTAVPTDKIICTLQKGKKSGVIGFYKFNSKTLKGNRAYLEFPLNSKVQALHFVFDEPTGIETVASENNAKTIYDLSGRAVKNISRGGIYIVNGKKIIVKLNR